MALQNEHSNGEKMSYINLREEFDQNSDSSKPDLSFKELTSEVLYLKDEEALKSKMGKDTFECEYCDLTSNSPEDLITHILSHLQIIEKDIKSYYEENHSEKDKKIHECEECGDIFIFTKTLTNQMQITTYKGDEDDENSCEECSNGLIKVGDFSNIFEINIPNKIYTCLYCNREFKSSNDHDLHLDQEHNVGQELLYLDSEEDNAAPDVKDDSGYFENVVIKQEKQVVVKQEKQVVKQEKKVVKQEKKVNVKQEKHVAVKQEKQIIVKQKKQMIVCKTYKPLHHMNRRNIEKENDVANITKEFKSTKSDEKYRPYACSKCTFRAVEEKTLEKHIKTHFLEKKFACKLCSYKGLTALTLQNHMKTHSDEKPYGCSHCLYRTNAVGNLRRHERQHTGEKPFPCKTCNYKATQKIALQNHMKSKHS